MKHPNPEQWMEFLYGELPRAARKELEQHLAVCQLCAREKTEYERTMSRLGKWKLETSAPVQTQSEWLRIGKWAAAAALLVSTGFATGRFSSPQLNPEEIQAQVAKPIEEKISRDLREKLDREVQLAMERELQGIRARIQLIAEKASADLSLNQEQLAAALAALRERDSALYASLEQLEAKNRQMRQDLEKVALFTDRSVRSAQRQLVQLASMTQPAE
jgi:hypothetical protein